MIRVAGGNLFDVDFILSFTNNVSYRVFIPSLIEIIKTIKQELCNL
jgi:hypothetical protein